MTLFDKLFLTFTILLWAANIALTSVAVWDLVNYETPKWRTVE